MFRIIVIATAFCIIAFAVFVFIWEMRE